jgi:hypothetical protein
LKDIYGAFASDRYLRQLLAEARETKGMVYLSKSFIDSRLFTAYHVVFPRWPHVKLHAFVTFDAATNTRVGWLFELESDLFRDVRFLMEKTHECYKGILTGKDRSPENRRNYHTYMHSSLSAIFQFLEAYLNGIAYDCFITKHDELPLKDHDYLAEWNTKRSTT